MVEEGKKPPSRLARGAALFKEIFVPINPSKEVYTPRPNRSPIRQPNPEPEITVGLITTLKAQHQARLKAEEEQKIVNQRNAEKIREQARIQEEKDRIIAEQQRREQAARENALETSLVPEAMNEVARLIHKHTYYPNTHIIGIILEAEEPRYKSEKVGETLYYGREWHEMRATGMVDGSIKIGEIVLPPDVARNDFKAVDLALAKAYAKPEWVSDMVEQTGSAYDPYEYADGD